MVRRLWQLWTLFTIACCCLFVRLAGVMLLNPAGSAAATPAGGLRTAAAREQLHLVQTADGRGHVLYANGGIFEPTRSNAIVGQIGLPDTWPERKRSVAKEGRSGLEYRFDDVLKLGKPAFIGERTSRTDTVLFARPGQSGVDVRTTIDDKWQAALTHAIAADRSERAAAVLLTIPSNQIIAMSQRGKDVYQNLAVTPQIPGSIFKLAVAAAALDALQVIAETHFVCDGTLHLSGTHMNCWRPHGNLSLVGAIAQSCDVSFAQIGVMMGRRGLTQVAGNLHLNETGLQTVAGLSVLPEAMPSRVFMRRGDDNGLLANTAIGQEDVRISPLQGALLASTVAQNGWYRDAQLVTDVERNGRTLEMFGTDGAKRAFSVYAARVIQRGMEDAVATRDGTAAWVQAVAGDCAVKTGTAELPDGRVNAWLVGYWPVRKPTYAFSIFIGDEPSTRAHEEVKMTFRRLYGQYRQFQRTPVIS